LRCLFAARNVIYLLMALAAAGRLRSLVLKNESPAVKPPAISCLC
jgi:hypothetical protein